MRLGNPGSLFQQRSLFFTSSKLGHWCYLILCPVREVTRCVMLVSFPLLCQNTWQKWKKKWLILAGGFSLMAWFCCFKSAARQNIVVEQSCSHYGGRKRERGGLYLQKHISITCCSKVCSMIISTTTQCCRGPYGPVISHFWTRLHCAFNTVLSQDLYTQGRHQYIPWIFCK